MISDHPSSEIDTCISTYMSEMNECMYWKERTHTLETQCVRVCEELKNLKKDFHTHTHKYTEQKSWNQKLMQQIHTHNTHMQKKNDECMQLHIQIQDLKDTICQKDKKIKGICRSLQKVKDQNAVLQSQVENNEGSRLAIEREEKCKQICEDLKNELKIEKKKKKQ